MDAAIGYPRLSTKSETSEDVKRNLKIENPMKKVRVRVPLPEKDKLISNCKYFAEHHHIPNRTTQDELRFYVQCRLREIEKQKLEIAKSEKRIERYKRCIKIAEEAIVELDLKETQKS